MQTATSVEALRRAVENAGGQSALAEQLTRLGAKPVSQAMVWNWLHRDKKAPAEHCPDIEAITGVACEDLRKEVNWSVLRGKPRRISQRTPAGTAERVEA